MPETSFPECTCLGCGHKWMPRTVNPKLCPNPKCRSSRWNKADGHRTPKFLKTIRTRIYIIDVETWTWAQRRASLLGYETTSEYLFDLIKLDKQKGLLIKKS